MPQVRVIGADGEMVGVLSRDDAIALGRGVRPGPGRDPAQCRSAGLPDHGLRQVQVRAAEEGQRGQEEDRSRSRSRNSSSGRSPTKATTRSSCATCAASSRKGDKVKVNIRFRGREMSHQELGREMAVAHRSRPGRGHRRRVAPAPGRAADGHDDRAEEEIIVGEADDTDHSPLARVAGRGQGVRALLICCCAASTHPSPGAARHPLPAARGEATQTP